MSLGVDSIENYPSPKKMVFFFHAVDAYVFWLENGCLFDLGTISLSTSGQLLFRPRVGESFFPPRVR